MHYLADATVFLVVQEDISSLQSSHMKPKNKVEIWKVSLSRFFLPSVILLQGSQTMKNPTN